MKIFQILDEVCHWDATNTHPTLEPTSGLYAPNIIFVEAPDNVYEGWGYNTAFTGDARFIEPTPPEGWLYDKETGAFYQDPNYTPPTINNETADMLTALKLLGIELEV